MSGVVSRTVDTGTGPVPVALLADPDGNQIELVGAPGAEPSLQVGLAARDVERTRAFYREALGVQEEASLVSEGERRFYARIGSAVQLKYWAADKTATVQTGALTALAGIRYVTVNVGDVDAAFGFLRDRGVRVRVPPTAVTVGRVCIVEDPDGNWIELAQMADAGSQ